MNILNRFTLQSLKKNKTRTVVTIIGIILSTAMICAVTTFASSVQGYLLDNAIYNSGDWHGCKNGTDYSTVEKISKSEEVDFSAYMQQLGYAEAKNCKNAFKPYIYVLGAGENAEKALPIHIVSGNFPTYANQILLPDHLASNGGIKYKIGDEITLNIGERLLDGYPMSQDTPIYTYDKNGEEVLNNETIDVKRTEKYFVCGFYERLGYELEKHSAPGYTAITLADAKPSADTKYDIYFKMNNPREVHDFMKDNNLKGNVNTDYLRFLGASGFANLDEMIVSLAAIIMALIIFGSVALIYNAFSISVSERTKQFGLLSSVGATKKQLRKTVFFEAFAVSVIGIPLGIISGIGGIGVTLYFVGNKFRSLIDSPIDLKLSVSGLSVVIAVIVALVTVLISAYIPSKRATRITAVEAIRQNKDIKAKAKTVKTSKVMYKLFGLPGMLASKHYKRSKKKYRATVLSLFMSIVLFISASAFTESILKASSAGLAPNDYDLSFSYYKSELENTTSKLLLNNFKDCTSVTSAVHLWGKSIYADINKTHLTEQVLDNLQLIGGDDDKDKSIAKIHTGLAFVDDDEFRRLLKENNLDENAFMSKFRPQAIAIDGRTIFDQENEKFIETKICKSKAFTFTAKVEKDIEGYSYFGRILDENGNEVHEYSHNETHEQLLVPVDEGFDNLTFYVGSVIYDVPFYIPKSSEQFILLYPDSAKKTILPNTSEDSRTHSYYFKSDNHEASYKALKQVIVDNNLESVYLNNYAANAEQERNIVTIIKVFAYGFIVLISLIAAANVFNTISTNISLRRREFAMLKSVGMSKKGFNRMMNYECLLYGAKALILGIPVSIGISVLIWVALNNGFETGYALPLSAIIIAVLSVFAVVFVSMLYSMSKIKKENPIDALKNENF